MLDYEAAHSHNLTVRARDPFTGSHTDAYITIMVTDVNDNPPEFTHYIFKGDVSEAAAPGHAILQVSLSLQVGYIYQCLSFSKFNEKLLNLSIEWVGFSYIVLYYQCPC